MDLYFLRHAKAALLASKKGGPDSERALTPIDLRIGNRISSEAALRHQVFCILMVGNFAL